VVEGVEGVEGGVAVFVFVFVFVLMVFVLVFVFVLVVVAVSVLARWLWSDGWWEGESSSMTWLVELLCSRSSGTGTG
jgi:hypothetical protein